MAFMANEQLSSALTLALVSSGSAKLTAAGAQRALAVNSAPAPPAVPPAPQPVEPGRGPGAAPAAGNASAPTERLKFMQVDQRKNLQAGASRLPQLSLSEQAAAAAASRLPQVFGDLSFLGIGQAASKTGGDAAVAEQAEPALSGEAARMQSQGFGKITVGFILATAVVFSFFLMLCFCARRLVDPSSQDKDQHSRRKAGARRSDLASGTRSASSGEPAAARFQERATASRRTPNKEPVNFHRTDSRVSNTRQAIAAMNRHRSSRSQPQMDGVVEAERGSDVADLPQLLMQSSLPGSAGSVRVVAQGTTAQWHSLSQKQLSQAASGSFAGPSGSQKASRRTSQTCGGTGAAGWKAPGQLTAQALGPPLGPPPPLYPGRVLPSSETRFAVPVDTLAVAGDHDIFDIMDLTDDIGMRVQVLPSSGAQAGRGLAVYKGRQAKDPCATVRKVGRPSLMADHRLEVRAADGALYGVLSPQADGSFVLTRNGQVVLNIMGDDRDMQLQVTAEDGKTMAHMTDSTAALIVEATFSAQPHQPKTEEHVRFTVLPGVDPVLVVTSVLSVLLFGLEVDFPCED